MGKSFFSPELAENWDLSLCQFSPERPTTLPKDQWGDAKQLKAILRKDKINVLYCYSHVCHLAATAAVEFTKKGYPVMELDGGWRWWKNDGFEIEK